MNVCCMTHNQYKQWELTGIRPDCNHHYHLSFQKAYKKIMEDEAVSYLPQRAIVLYGCVERYAWKGAFSGDARVMQMKPIVRY